MSCPYFRRYICVHPSSLTRKCGFKIEDWITCPFIKDTVLCAQCGSEMRLNEVNRCTRLPYCRVIQYVCTNDDCLHITFIHSASFIEHWM
jgi:predicted Zn-ribbon and HTH transcriptional regulator